MVIRNIANVNIEFEKLKRNGKTKSYKYGGELETFCIYENKEIKINIRLIKGTGAKYFNQKAIYIGSGDDNKKEYFTEEQFKRFVNDDSWIKADIIAYLRLWENNKKRLKLVDFKILEKKSDKMNINEEKKGQEIDEIQVSNDAIKNSDARINKKECLNTEEKKLRIEEFDPKNQSNNINYFLKQEKVEVSNKKQLNKTNLKKEIAIK